jgi:hypothetical protein
MRLTPTAISLIAEIALLFSAQTLSGQTAARDTQVTAVVQQLFVAMKASDTAASRSAFVANGRVIPIQAGAQAPALGQGLSIDQFVAFVGRNAAGTWVERLWNPVVRISGPLADLWFEYDVYRGSTLDHCGVNSVQLQETTTGWKIVTMAFTSVAQGCAAHQPSKTAIEDW